MDTLQLRNHAAIRTPKYMNSCKHPLTAFLFSNYTPRQVFCGKRPLKVLHFFLLPLTDNENSQGRNLFGRKVQSLNWDTSEDKIIKK